MRAAHTKWLPAGLLALGVLATTAGVHTQKVMKLERPLEGVIPQSYLGWPGSDVVISEEEQRVAGMTEYVLRRHARPGADAEEAAATGFSVYVGYYESQSQGKTIHSPKNCLPGGGWEPLTSRREMIETALGPVVVNRYLIGNGAAKALVLYWYQGRGRIEANEYLVKWDLLRDQALLGRSDEALVRIIVPVSGSEDEAYAQAEQVAKELVVDVDRALPGRG